jgi:hypothetical protein
VPLSLYIRPSFKRSFKSLGSEQKKVTGLILESLQAYYSTACNLEEAQKIAPGFFYKQLKRPYYEAGIEKNLRVVIRHEQEDRIAILAGNHDQIKQFLASNR